MQVFRKPTDAQHGTPSSELSRTDQESQPQRGYYIHAFYFSELTRIKCLILFTIFFGPQLEVQFLYFPSN
jgi:hypothetical protein